MTTIHHENSREEGSPFLSALQSGSTAVLGSFRQTKIPRRNYTKNKATSVALAVAMLSALNCGKVSAATTIETIGDVSRFALPITAVGMTIYHKDGEGAIQFGKSLALTMGVTLALKSTINEERPDNSGNDSFPSGHTSASFSSAEFIRKRYGGEFGVPAYALATFVGYSRVESDKHHTRDVAAGAAIGILSSYIFTKPYHGWNVQIEGDSKGGGVILSRSF